RGPAERRVLEEFEPALGVAELALRALAAQHLDALGLDRSRIDAEDAHAPIRALGPDRARERHQRGVADAARDIGGGQALAGGADDVDDDAAAALAHAREIGAR